MHRYIYIEREREREREREGEKYVLYKNIYIYIYGMIVFHIDIEVSYFSNYKMFRFQTPYVGMCICVYMYVYFVCWNKCLQSSSINIYSLLISVVSGHA
jgi:hypothetical protein